MKILRWFFEGSLVDVSPREQAISPREQAISPREQAISPREQPEPVPKIDVCPFALEGEAGVDPARIERERREEAQRSAESARFASRQQALLASCPGLMGCNPPAGAGRVGSLIIQVERVAEAMDWLKRRYRVSDRVEFRHGGIHVEIIARDRTKTVPGKKRSASFAPIEQFELSL